MNITSATKQMIAQFAREEDGAQIVEYGLIIAVGSIARVLALSALAGNGANDPFTVFIARVNTCLTTANCV